MDVSEDGVCPLITKSVYKTTDKVGFSCCTGGSLGSQIVVFAGRDDGQIFMLIMIGGEKLSWENLYNFGEGWREAADGVYTPLWDLRFVSKVQVSKKSKPVTQVCCDSTSRIIFALSDGIVSMLSWDQRELHFLAHVTEDKGVPLKNTLFMSINEHRGRRRLVTTVKKSSKIHIFEYSNEGHISPYTDPQYKTQLLEVRTSEPILKAYLINDTLCSCTKDEYRTADLTGATGISAVDREEKGRKYTPAILPVPEFSEFILQLDRISERHGSRDAPSLPEWDFVPTALHVVEPYYLLATCFGDGVPKVQAISLMDLADKEIDTSNAVFGPYVVPTTGIRNLNGGLETCGGAGGYFFFCGSHTIHCISSQPMLKQLCKIIDTPTTDDTGTRVELHNADTLLRHTLRDGTVTSTGDEPEQRSSVMCFLCKRVGFSSLDAGDFATAFESFTIAYDHDPQYIDAREILILFGLQSVLHSYMDGIKSTRNNLREILEPLRSQEGTYKEEILTAKRHLYSYLKHTRSDDDQELGSPEGSPCGEQKEVSNEARAIDTALLYLYLDLFEDRSVRESDHTPEPNEFWSILRGNLDYETCTAELRRLGKFRCLAMLKVHEGFIAEALDLLHSLGNSDSQTMQEEGQDGVAETVHALQQCVGEEGNGLVYEYLPWILERNPQQAIKALLVFRDPPLNVARVLSLLDTFPDDIVMDYLDHTVTVEGNSNPKYHTKLAMKYISSITCVQGPNTLKSVQGGHEAGLLGELRRKFQRLLRVSPSYDAVRVLSHLEGTQLHDEMVIAYSHIDEHRSALQILLFKLQDETRAIEYCKIQYRRALQKHLMLHLGQQEPSYYLPNVGNNFHATGGGDFLQVPGHDSPGSPLSGSRKLNSSTIGSPRFRSKPFPSTADSPSSTRGPSPGLGLSRERSDDVMNNNYDNTSSDAFDLNHAVLRPDEFFAIHQTNLPIFDKLGNVFVGIRKHNIYLLELLNQSVFPARGDHSERKLNVEFSLRLLEKHYTEMNPLFVLKMLPPDILAVSQIQKYLTRVFQQTASLQHEVRIQKNVAQGNKLKHEADRALLLSRCVVVDHDRTCAVCHRPMRDGNTSVAFPNLLVTHYKCLQDNTKDPKTGSHFWVDMNIVRPRVKIGDLP